MNSKYESLVKLVSSEYIKDICIVYYLHQHINKEQVVIALIEKMRKLPEKRLLDLLPNIIYVFRISFNKKLEKFLSQLCTERFQKYLIVKWAFDAYIFTADPSQQLQQSFEDIRNRMDSKIINGIEQDFSNLPQGVFQTKIINWTKQKQQRSSYVNYLNDFYNSLVKISLKLKKYLPDDRHKKLIEYLKKYFQRLRIKMSDQGKKINKIKKGAFFPISDPSSFFVNILYENCYPLSTKQRVPYKLVFQTVDHNELTANQLQQKFEFTKNLHQNLSNHINEYGQQIQQQQQSGDDDQDQNENSQKNRLKVEIMKKKQKETAEKMNQYLQYVRKYGSIIEDQNSSINTNNKKQSLKLQHSYFQVDWNQKVQKIRKQSPFNQFKSYKVRGYLVKGGDDLRQQHFAMQLIKFIKGIFDQFNLKLWIRPYDIIMLSRNSGFIQYLPNTMTIGSLKKYQKFGTNRTLKQIYYEIFGDKWDIASHNFTMSLAGYSLIQYIFQIKDRHNGNILIDSDGHIIHIDFSFLLTNSPGNMNFQKAPFKLTQQYIQLMGGKNSDMFNYFKQLLFIGFAMVKRYTKQIISFIDTIMHNSDLPCFRYYNKKLLQNRLMQTSTDDQIRKAVDTLVWEAETARSTLSYDRFQFYTNGICY